METSDVRPTLQTTLNGTLTGNNIIRTADPIRSFYIKLVSEVDPIKSVVHATLHVDQ